MVCLQAQLSHVQSEDHELDIPGGEFCGSFPDGYVSLCFVQ